MELFISTPLRMSAVSNLYIHPHRLACRKEVDNSEMDKSEIPVSRIVTKWEIKEVERLQHLAHVKRDLRWGLSFPCPFPFPIPIQPNHNIDDMRERGSSIVIYSLDPTPLTSSAGGVLASSFSSASVRSSYARSKHSAKRAMTEP